MENLSAYRDTADLAKIANIDKMLNISSKQFIYIMWLNLVLLFL